MQQWRCADRPVIIESYIKARKNAQRFHIVPSGGGKHTVAREVVVVIFIGNTYGKRDSFRKRVAT